MPPRRRRGVIGLDQAVASVPVPSDINEVASDFVAMLSQPNWKVLMSRNLANFIAFLQRWVVDHTQPITALPFQTFAVSCRARTARQRFISSCHAILADLAKEDMMDSDSALTVTVTLLTEMGRTDDRIETMLNAARNAFRTRKTIPTWLACVLDVYLVYRTPWGRCVRRCYDATKNRMGNTEMSLDTAYHALRDLLSGPDDKKGSFGDTLRHVHPSTGAWLRRAMRMAREDAMSPEFTIQRFRFLDDLQHVVSEDEVGLVKHQLVSLAQAMVKITPIPSEGLKSKALMILFESVMDASPTEFVTSVCSGFGLGPVNMRHAIVTSPPATREEHLERIVIAMCSMSELVDHLEAMVAVLHGLLRPRQHAMLFAHISKILNARVPSPSRYNMVLSNPCHATLRRMMISADDEEESRYVGVLHAALEGGVCEATTDPCLLPYHKVLTGVAPTSPPPPSARGSVEEIIWACSLEDGDAYLKTLPTTNCVGAALLDETGRYLLSSEVVTPLMVKCIEQAGWTLAHVVCVGFLVLTGVDMTVLTDTHESYVKVLCRLAETSPIAARLLVRLEVVHGKRRPPDGWLVGHLKDHDNLAACIEAGSDMVHPSRAFEVLGQALAWNKLPNVDSVFTTGITLHIIRIALRNMNGDDTHTMHVGCVLEDSLCAGGPFTRLLLCPGNPTSSLCVRDGPALLRLATMLSPLFRMEKATTVLDRTLSLFSDWTELTGHAGRAWAVIAETAFRYDVYTPMLGTWMHPYLRRRVEASALSDSVLVERAIHKLMSGQKTNLFDLLPDTPEVVGMLLGSGSFMEGAKEKIQCMICMEPRVTAALHCHVRDGSGVTSACGNEHGCSAVTCHSCWVRWTEMTGDCAYCKRHQLSHREHPPKLILDSLVKEVPEFCEECMVYGCDGHGVREKRQRCA